MACFGVIIVFMSDIEATSLLCTGYFHQSMQFAVYFYNSRSNWVVPVFIRTHPFPSSLWKAWSRQVIKWWKLFPQGLKLTPQTHDSDRSGSHQTFIPHGEMDKNWTEQGNVLKSVCIWQDSPTLASIAIYNQWHTGTLTELIEHPTSMLFRN